MTIRIDSLILTLCDDCADVIKEDDTQVIVRVNRRQRVREPCYICRRCGYEYEVRDKEIKK